MSPHFSLQTDKRHTHIYRMMWQSHTQINDHDGASFDVLYILHNSWKETTDWNHRIYIFSNTAHFDRVTHKGAFQAKAAGYLAASFFYLRVLDDKPSNDHEDHNGNNRQKQAHARAATFGALVQNCKSLLHTLNETNFVSVQTWEKLNVRWQQNVLNKDRW